MAGRKTNKWVVLSIIAAFAFGWMCSYLSIFSWMAIALVATCIFIVILISFLFAKSSKKYGLILLVYCVSLLIAWITCVQARNYRLNNRLKLAKRIVLEIEHYKEGHGAYPHDLKDIEMDESIGIFNYEVDSNSYSLYYNVDGWHNMYYNSNSKEWKIID